MVNQVRVLVGPQYPRLVTRGDSIYETTKAEVLCDKKKTPPYAKALSLRCFTDNNDVSTIEIL